MKKNTKEMKGITLIALVITIVVLLILAAISIATLTGDHGILTQAQRAKEEQTHAEVKDSMSLLYNEYMLVKKSESGSEDITFIEYAKNNGHVDSNGIINTQKLVGSKLDLGNGTETTGDIYKLEEGESQYIVNYYKNSTETAEKLVWEVSDEFLAKQADNKIVDILGTGVALTKSGKVVTLNEGNETLQWQQVEIKEELSEINGVSKAIDKAYSYYIIDKSENLYAWGNNEYGQLGTGDKEYKTTPVKVNGVNNIEDIYSDGYIVIAKDTSGNLYAWGVNWYGQLGTGNKEDKYAPTKINGISNVEVVYMSDYNVIAKDTSGNLYAWGVNWYGQLGIGDTENKTTPVRINGISNIEDVYMSDYNVIAKDTNGNLYAWGNNEYGQLGIGDTEDKTTPVKINGISNVKDVLYNDGLTVIAKDTSGNLYAWGNNEYGQLGTGDTENRTTPVKINGNSDIEDVYISDFEIIFKDTSGNLYACGNNEYGQLGTGDTENRTNPVKINGISNIEDVYIGDNYVITKDKNGNLYAWGYNEYGQLGTGDTENKLTPVCLNNISEIPLYNKNVNKYKKCMLSSYFWSDYIITSSNECYTYKCGLPT